LNQELIYKEALKGKNTAAIRDSIKFSGNLISAEKCDELVEFDHMLDILDAVCDEASSVTPQIETAIRLLIEASDRVRNPKEMQTLLKHRLTRATIGKGANKQNRAQEDMKELQKKATNNFNNNVENMKQNLQKAAPNLGNGSGGGGASSSSSSSSASNSKDSKDNNEDKAQEAKKECYQRMIDQCQINEEVDRVLNNYSKLSKRFNIDKVFCSMEGNIEDNVDMYCSLFETWTDEEMSRKSKFNVEIETALYLNDKLAINIPRERIIESIVDYNLFAAGRKSDPAKLYDNIRYYMAGNKMLTAEDCRIYDDYIYSESDDILSEAVKKASTNKCKEVLNNFKKGVEKTPEKLKQLTEEFFGGNENDIVDELPNLFSIVRMFVTLLSFGINPILGVVTAIGNHLLKIKFTRKQYEKIIDKYEKEIEKTKKKIEKTNNSKTKERLTAYQNETQKTLSRIQEKEKELYTDAQNQKREEERYAKMYGTSNDDFDLDEAMSVIIVADKFLNESPDSILDKIRDNILILAENDMIYNITSILIRNSSYINIKQLSSIYEEGVYILRSDSKRKNYVLIDSLNNNINRLKDIKENAVGDYRSLAALYKLDEALDLIGTDNASYYFLEVSFNNTLNIVKTKIQDAAKALSDKDKKISQDIDVAVDGFKQSVERYFSTESREQVLRGSILPSASKLLKMCLVAGLAAWMIHPLAAVIGILGYIGVSKHAQSKERQAILDEIDTELEMVDRYIQEADNKNDMKALKNLLNTKKRLKREKHRIRYKMKIQYGEIPNAERYHETDDSKYDY
jgi:F0F1-type ATP synthase membrane subunit b/b'